MPTRPNRATAVTLLDDSGLGATYVASRLRPDRPAQPERPTQAEPPPQPAATPQLRNADQRLRELEALKQEGLVTDEEYTGQRKAIIDSL